MAICWECQKDSDKKKLKVMATIVVWVLVSVLSILGVLKTIDIGQYLWYGYDQGYAIREQLKEALKREIEKGE